MKTIFYLVVLLLCTSLTACQPGDTQKVKELETKVLNLKDSMKESDAALKSLVSAIRAEQKRDNEKLEMNEYLANMAAGAPNISKSEKLRECLDDCRTQEAIDVAACRKAFPTKDEGEVIQNSGDYDDCIRDALNRGSNCEYACRQEFQ